MLHANDFRKHRRNLIQNSFSLMNLIRTSRQLAVIGDIQNNKACRVAKHMSLGIVGGKIKLNIAYIDNYLKFYFLSTCLIVRDVFFIYVTDIEVISFQVRSTIPKDRVRVTQRTAIKVFQ